MSTNDLDAIEARAKAAGMNASGKRWALDEDDTTVRANLGAGPTVAVTIPLGYGIQRRNAEHIAGMDPETTLGLVAEVRDLRAKVARVEALAEEWQRDHDADTNGRHGYHATEYADHFAADVRAALAGEPT